MSLIGQRESLAPTARADIAFDHFARSRRFEESAGSAHSDIFRRILIFRVLLGHPLLGAHRRLRCAHQPSY
jgi:hypothetical protein